MQVEQFLLASTVTSQQKVFQIFRDSGSLPQSKDTHVKGISHSRIGCKARVVVDLSMWGLIYPAHLLLYLRLLCLPPIVLVLCNFQILYLKHAHFDVWLLLHISYLSFKAAMFMEHWKRRQMRLNYEWDLTGFEDEEVSNNTTAFLCERIKGRDPRPT